MIGKTISHYKILEKIGGGGMGVVHKAQDLKLDRFVALKFLPPQLTTSEEDKQRFIREAKAASSLDHTNICAIYEIDETEDGQLFISMVYYEGETLEKKIEERPLSIAEAIDTAIQIAQGLAKAHGKEIVHRDIKPANIIVTKDDVVKILDFGLAKLSSQTKLTKESTTLGTICYMSPEQAKGEEVDQRTDIWSLGVILYEMLTGQLPFKGEYDSAVVYSIMNEKQQPVSGLRTGVPLELERIINKCLQKDPGYRYQHVEDLIVDLRSMQKDSDAKRDTTKFSRIKKNKRYRLNQLIKPGIFIIAAITIVFIYFTMFQRAESKSPIPIAVVDFVNETGDGELNGLSGMLSTALEQSKRVSIVTRSHMFDILKQMGRENVEKIDEILGKEIAMHAKINLLALATIRKFDQLYNIDLKVLNTTDDTYIFTESVKGEGKANIPSLIDELSDKTRRDLEESEEEISQSNQPVALLTSSSLAAYQHYFKGQEYIDKLMFNEAESEFCEALKIDSTFGLAYYRLAYAMNWELDFKHAKTPINKAFKYINQIPDKEKYLVHAVKTTIDSGWGNASLDVLKEMEQVYPDDKEMIYNIGDIQYHIGNYEESKKYLEKVLEIDPNSGRALQHVIWVYGELLEFGLLQKAFEKYEKIAGYMTAYQELIYAYYSAGNYTKVEDSVDAQFKRIKSAVIYSENKHETYEALYTFYINRGMDSLAIKCMNKLIESDSLNVYYYNMRGFAYYLTGNFGKSEEDFLKGLKINPNHFDTLKKLAELYIALKKYKDAERILRFVETLHPDNDLEWEYSLLFASKGQKSKAKATRYFNAKEVSSLLGEEEAFEYLASWSEIQRKLKKSLYYRLKSSPFLDNIRSNPLFKDVFEKDKRLFEENLEKYGDIDI